MNDVTRILTRIRFDVVNESRHLRILFVVYHKKAQILFYVIQFESTQKGDENKS